MLKSQSSRWRVLRWLIPAAIVTVLVVVLLAFLAIANNNVPPVPVAFLAQNTLNSQVAAFSAGGALISDIPPTTSGIGSCNNFTIQEVMQLPSFSKITDYAISTFGPGDNRNIITNPPDFPNQNAVNCLATSDPGSKDMLASGFVWFFYNETRPVVAAPKGSVFSKFAVQIEYVLAQDERSNNISSVPMNQRRHSSAKFARAQSGW